MKIWKFTRRTRTVCARTRLFRSTVQAAVDEVGKRLAEEAGVLVREDVGAIKRKLADLAPIPERLGALSEEKKVAISRAEVEEKRRLVAMSEAKNANEAVAHFEKLS